MFERNRSEHCVNIGKAQIKIALMNDKQTEPKFARTKQEYSYLWIMLRRIFQI